MLLIKFFFHWWHIPKCILDKPRKLWIMDDYRSSIKWKNNPAILCALKSCVVFSDLFLLFERKKLSRKKILGNFSFCYHYHFICSILYTFTYIVYVDIFCVSSYMYNVYLCENSSNFYLFFYRWHFNREEFQGKFYSAPYTYCMELLVYIVINQPATHCFKNSIRIGYQ